MRRLAILLVFAACSVADWELAGAQDSTNPPRAYKPFSPDQMSLAGISLGQRLEDIEREYPSRWTRGYSKEHGLHLYRMPNAPKGEPGIIISAGDSMPNDGIVRLVSVFAFPSKTYFSHDVVPEVLELAWGSAIQLEGSPYDRLWLHPSRKAGIRLRYWQPGSGLSERMTITLAPQNAFFPEREIK